MSHDHHKEQEHSTEPKGRAKTPIPWHALIYSVSRQTASMPYKWGLAFKPQTKDLKAVLRKYTNCLTGRVQASLPPTQCALLSKYIIDTMKDELIPVLVPKRSQAIQANKDSDNEKEDKKDKKSKKSQESSESNDRPLLALNQDLISMSLSFYTYGVPSSTPKGFGEIVDRALYVCDLKASKETDPSRKFDVKFDCVYSRLIPQLLHFSSRCIRLGGKSNWSAVDGKGPPRSFTTLAQNTACANAVALMAVNWGILETAIKAREEQFGPFLPYLKKKRSEAEEIHKKQSEKLPTIEENVFPYQWVPSEEGSDDHEGHDEHDDEHDEHDDDHEEDE